MAHQALLLQIFLQQRTSRTNKITAQNYIIIRPMYTNPTVHGVRIAATVYTMFDWIFSIKLKQGLSRFWILITD
uniref:Uncharacterized protein n=1 Tax=Tetranychus urticae TaxID=32264 RepID=T1KL06_TETUR